MDHQVKYLLQESELPRQWYNVIPDLPSPAAAAAAPGHRAAGRPGRPRAAVPGRPDRPGSVRRPVHPHPRGGPRRLPAVAADAAVPGPAAGEGPRHAGPDLLQVRGRQPGRVAQAEHRGAAGVLQRGRGRDPADHRDRGRPVGQRAGVRLGRVRPAVRGLAGPGLLRPEAVPPAADGDLRGDRAPQPVGRDPRRARRCWPPTRTPPAAWASRSARRSRSPPGTRPPGTRWAACSTTCCCTRP